ncbi:MAG TPA: hypothetical protein VFW74_14365 [Acidimicrobiia bacterium]|nr:hypothetical protein [Acidimicrobiia bacterium]
MSSHRAAALHCATTCAGRRPVTVTRCPFARPVAGATAIEGVTTATWTVPALVVVVVDESVTVDAVVLGVLVLVLLVLVLLVLGVLGTSTDAPSGAATPTTSVRASTAPASVRARADGLGIERW